MSNQTTTRRTKNSSRFTLDAVNFNVNPIKTRKSFLGGRIKVVAPTRLILDIKVNGIVVGYIFCICHTNSNNWKMSMTLLQEHPCSFLPKCIICYSKKAFSPKKLQFLRKRATVARTWKKFTEKMPNFQKSTTIPSFLWIWLFNWEGKPKFWFPLEEISLQVIFGHKLF